MKKTHILAILVIAVAIGILISTAGDASTYVSFDQAYQMASSGNKSNIHVVGELKKDADGKVTGIEPGPDRLSFSFKLIDEAHREQTVYYNEPMPPDFTRSEKIVVIGGFQGERFVATKILLKCPSKYQENKLNAKV
jgi:cytochrome c-type biogenesis protein CcmE